MTGLLKKHSYNKEQNTIKSHSSTEALYHDGTVREQSQNYARQ